LQARNFRTIAGFLGFQKQLDGIGDQAMESDAWIKAAWQARERAYAPYSNFAVGAALLAADGRIFSGCNVENISYGLTMCAERVAIGAALAAGARDFVAMAVVADTAVPISPCGACRQVMAEFGVPRVLLANRTEWLEFTLSELLPRASAGILDRTE
jgi:cytidine deaminase